MKSSLKIILSMLCFLAGMVPTGCVNDNNIYEDPVQTGSDKVKICIKLDLSTEAPGTRAWTSPGDPADDHEDVDLDEETLVQQYIDPEDVYIIFYKAPEDPAKFNDPSEWIIDDVPQLSPANIRGEQGTRERVLELEMATCEYPVRVRVLCNVATASSFGVEPSLVHDRLQRFVGRQSDNYLCSRIKADNFVNGKWPLTSTSNFLPMHSAISEPFYIRKEDVNVINNELIKNMKLYRSVAKVGVEYTGEDARYQLREVHLINPNEYGAFLTPLAPNEDIHLQYEAPYIIGTPTVSASVARFVPTITRVPDPEHPMEFLINSDNKVLDKIFLPETVTTGVEDEDVHLVAYFSKDNSSELLACPLYFTEDGHPGTNPYNIIRNHSYIFKITWIKDREFEVIIDSEWDEEHELLIE